MHGLVKIAGGAILALSPVAAQAELIYGLTFQNSIVTFDSASASTTLSSGAISGLASGEVLTGIDFRPATATLYSLSTLGNLYTLTSSGGAFTAALAGTTTLPNGSAFGIDFNPVPDRLRFVSDTNQNLRINPMGGATINDGAITLNGSSNVDLIAAAYTNSFAGAATTTLYAIDSLSGALVVSTNPNMGTYTSVGSLGIGLPNVGSVGFDISGVTGSAFLNVDNSLYQVSLGTGVTTSIGTIGAGALRGISAAPSAVPEPATWAMFIGGFGFIGAAMRRRQRTSVRFA